MSARFFLDTNILIYAMDPSDPEKQSVALRWVGRAHETGLGVVSYQVVQEWFYAVLRKAKVRYTPEEAEAVYRTLLEPLWRIDSSRALVATAIGLHREHSFSWWDSLIVSAALEADCGWLLSEDLQHGREVGGLRIENPFLKPDSYS